MKKIIFCVIALALLGLAVWLVLLGIGTSDAASPGDAVSSPRQDKDLPSENAVSSSRQDKALPSGDAGFSSRQNEKETVLEERGEDTASPDSEEQTEDAEEAAVEAFDNLTDKWMEPAAKGVTMADVDSFVAQFRKVPKDRQEECLQRALNLVPDENVMLLAGVLMDKSQPKELVELVFNDVLNRDEDVKKPILQQIFKDKSHPCWADTAWVFDVTGETSK